MSQAKTHVCPVEHAGGLDNRIRKWLQDPRKIVGPYVREGMTVLDVGCGPGFFTVEMARLAGESGRVIAADLQEGMLQKVREKIKGGALESRITLHKCEQDKIGLAGPVDFVLLFFMVHEVPDIERFFREIAELLKPEGRVLLVEPPIHVSKKAFSETLDKARQAGLAEVERPKVFLSKAVLLQKSGK